MSKSEKVFNWLLIGIFAILFVCIKQVAADPANSYGEAQFYNPVHIPRDNIQGRWLLDPGLTGDLQSAEGSMEVWVGTVGGCTVCPFNYWCNCSVGGDIAQETTKIRDLNSSAKLSATGTLHSLLSYLYTLEANKAYQMDFCYVGEDGTEDVAWGVGNTAFDDTYNFATDTFTGAVTYGSALNIGTDWTCRSAYVTTGAAEKANYFFVVGLATADGSFIYVDEYRIRELHTVGVVGERGNILSVPVTADPVFGSSPLLQHKPGVGQVTKRGMKLDGVDDFVSRADDDTFDPVTWDSGGLFSVGCRLVTDTVAAGTLYIINKWGAAGNRSWSLFRSTLALGFAVSGDGTGIDSNSAAMFTADTLHSFVSTFDPSGGSGACVNNLYYNAYQVDTDATMTECGPFDSTADLQIGAQLAASFWPGSMLECSLWDSELSAVEANKYINPYFPGTNHGDGFYVDTCSQAASHATCTLDSCRDGTPAACQAEGTGAFAAFGQFTELVDDNSFETFTGDDSAPTFTHWTSVETAGDGSANITAYRADKIHGEASLRLTTTGTTSWTLLRSACIAVTPTSIYRVSAKTKAISGAPNLLSSVRLFTDGACANYSWAPDIYDAAISGPWFNDLNVNIAMGAGINSVQLDLFSWQSAGDMLIDTVSFKEANYHTPGVHNVGAGSTTYNARVDYLDSPLARRSDILREEMYESGMCISTWVYTDWSGNDGSDHVFLHHDGTAGNNNQFKLEKAGNDNIYFWVWDSVAGSNYNVLAVTDTNWTASDWKYVEACWNNGSAQVAHWYNVANSTWYDMGARAGAGTGVWDDAGLLHVGNRDGIDLLDGYISWIGIGPYNAIFPLEGFNFGNSPVNGRPY